MKRKNMATMVTCIALVGVVAVGGTLALLSKPSNTVRNTFTVGEGYTENDIILSEADVKQVINGDYVVNPSPAREEEPVYTLNGQDRYETNDYINLVTGTTIYKDPMVTVAANTPDSWVVAYIGTVDSAFSTSTFEPTNTSWYKVTKEDGHWKIDSASVGAAGQEGKPLTIQNGYYIYKNVVTKAGEDTNLPKLFENLDVQIAEDSIPTGADQDLTPLTVKAGLVQYTTGVTDATQLDDETTYELDVIMDAVANQINK
nr:hypothetical protein [Fournierella massiliensis]